MTVRWLLLILFGIFPTAGLAAEEGLGKDRAYALFTQANDAFRQANAIADDPVKADGLYEKAILTYEKIIDEGRIQNPRLYYNLANAYLLREDVGRAVLNYRRAQKLDKSDTNIQKNLAFARSRRIDKVEPRTEKRVLATLFFWHYDLSMKMKFDIACVCFGALCLAVAAAIWLGRRASLTVVAGVSAVLLLCFVGSLGIEGYRQSTQLAGVIIAPEVVAYQGDGQNYPPSFKAPLHAGTEFELIERRPGWLHIRLADGSDGWLAQSAVGLI